jgi:HlyD family secretion protein
MIKFFAALVCTALVAGAIALVDRQTADFAAQPRVVAVASAPTQIFASGFIEGSTEEIELLPEAAGRVAEVAVTLGQWVEAGQVLLRIDDRTPRAQVAVSLANLQMAQANLDRLVNGARESEREEARAFLTAKQARLKQAMLSWQRVQTLRAQDVLSQQEADDQEGVFHTMRAEVEACQARVNQLEAPARDDELRAAQARVAAAQADFELSQIVLDRTTLRAPCRAQVIDVHIEPGEMIATERIEPVIVLSDTARLRVRAFVEEIDAPRIEVGATAEVTADGLPGQLFAAIVASVSPRMAKKMHTSDQPDELFDSRVREVLLEIDAKIEPRQLIVGLRVDVKFLASADGVSAKLASGKSEFAKQPM